MSDDEVLIDESAQGLSSSSDSVPLPSEIEVRKVLQFHFMNPVDKWRAKQRFPYKLVVQIVKIFFVTVQIYLFAINRSKHIDFSWNSKMTFSNLFLNQWDSTREIVAYPPDQGPLAIYTKQEFYQTIDYAYGQYLNISTAIGPYFYTGEHNETDAPLLCFKRFKEATIFGYNESYVFNPDVNETCVKYNVEAFKVNKSQEFLAQFPELVNFQSMISARMIFGLKTVNLKDSGPLNPPECYKFEITVEFSNDNDDGQVLVTLEADTYRLDCKGDRIVIASVTTYEQVLQYFLDFMVIALCFVSLILCIRALSRAKRLCKQTENFFRLKMKRSLSSSGKWEFVNCWYILITINDVFLIVGSVIKQKIEKSRFASNEWNVCGLFLGIGILLVWIGILRYLCFFKTYNVLILTLKLAFPSVVRFLICVLVIYCGFTLCGWLVLGPYNLKFRSLSLTSECLFSLINGDDMFATFSTTLSTRSNLIWWFSRIYLYSFIALFIYVVLSVFISIILDSYETIKLYDKQGMPKNDLQQFIGDKIPLDQFSDCENAQPNSSSRSTGVSFIFRRLPFLFGSR